MASLEGEGVSYFCDIWGFKVYSCEVKDLNSLDLVCNWERAQLSVGN